MEVAYSEYCVILVRANFKTFRKHPGTAMVPLTLYTSTEKGHAYKYFDLFAKLMMAKVNCLKECKIFEALSFTQVTRIRGMATP